MVDSGAWTSCFPLQVAYDLGIQQHELNEDPHGGGGVGSRFRFWKTSLTIMAVVVYFDSNPDGSDRTWGAPFALDPAFVEHDNFLLGRSDFFRAFGVSFEADELGQRFHLDYVDVAPQPLPPIPNPG